MVMIVSLHDENVNTQAGPVELDPVSVSGILGRLWIVRDFILNDLHTPTMIRCVSPLNDSLSTFASCRSPLHKLVTSYVLAFAVDNDKLCSACRWKRRGFVVDQYSWVSFFLLRPRGANLFTCAPSVLEEGQHAIAVGLELLRLERKEVEIEILARLSVVEDTAAKG
jgi:hypothetical protein